MLRVRAYRSGYPAKRRPLFLLNAELVNSIKRRCGWTDLTIALFSGLSRSAIVDYKRGGRGGKRRAIRATRESAAKIARALRCDFSQLWSEA
jgi:hypothetical protein